MYQTIPHVASGTFGYGRGAGRSRDQDGSRSLTYPLRDLGQKGWHGLIANEAGEVKLRIRHAPRIGTVLSNVESWTLENGVGAHGQAADSKLRHYRGLGGSGEHDERRPGGT